MENLMAKQSRKYLLNLDDATWRLLARYSIILDYLAHKAGRKKAKNIADVISGVLTKWLKDNAQYIEEEYWATMQGALSETIPVVYPPEYLIAIDAISGIDAVGLAGARRGRVCGEVKPDTIALSIVFGRHGRRLGKKQKSVRDLRSQPGTDVLRDVGGPETLRPGSRGAGPALGVRAEKSEDANPGGAPDLGLRDAGVGESKAPETSWWRRTGPSEPGAPGAGRVE